MLSTDREAFDKALAAMFGAWNRVCSSDAKEGYWQGCSQMGLTDFVRSTQKAIATFVDHPDFQLPHVGALWGIKRNLRARAPEKPEPEVGDFDGWACTANMHLLSYIQHSPKRYHPDSRMVVVIRNGQKFFEIETGPLGGAITQILVAAKNEWAQYMRESDGKVEVQDQRDVWANCMAAAERRIDSLLSEAA